MFCYRDKYNILHAVTDRKIAEANTKEKGAVIEVEGFCINGYPVAPGPAIVDYGNGETYINGNRADGKNIKRADGVTQGLVMAFLQTIKAAGL